MYKQSVCVSCVGQSFFLTKELRDENGRLRKLLAEKDYEIGYLRRIQEEERQAFVGNVSVGEKIYPYKQIMFSSQVQIRSVVMR